MLVLYEAVDTSSYPEAQGPRWRIPNATSVAVGIATAVGVFALLGLDPLEMRSGYRLVLSVLLAAAVWIAGTIDPWLRSGVVRVRNYESLRDHALTLESLLVEERYRTRMLTLRLSYVVSARDALSVIGIILADTDGRDLLALDNVHGVDLLIGDKVTIIDPLTWDFLGSFEIVGHPHDMMVAVPTDTPDALWWGYLRQQAVVHAHANTRAVAVRVQG